MRTRIEFLSSVAWLITQNMKAVWYVQRKIGEYFCSWYMVGMGGSVLYSYIMAVKVNRSFNPLIIHLIIASHPYLSKYDDE